MNSSLNPKRAVAELKAKVEDAVDFKDILL